MRPGADVAGRRAAATKGRVASDAPVAVMSKRRIYNRVARLYDLLDLPFEKRRYQPIRPELFAGTSGTILDAGVGTGRNMPFYPAGADSPASTSARACWTARANSAPRLASP